MGVVRRSADAAGRPVTGGEDLATGRHRLHPATPLLRGVRRLGILIAAFSWQGYTQLGPVRWLAAVALVLVVAVAVSAISWAVTGFAVVGRELHIWEGLLWRRHRSIPLERLQAVDVVRPPLARLVGVAELRLEVVGGGRAEAPLAYLNLRQAALLRERLLALGPGSLIRTGTGATAGSRTGAGTGATDRTGAAAGTGAAVGVGVGVPDAVAGAGSTGVPAGHLAAERLLHAVDNRRLLLGQLLTPHALLLPFAVALTLMPFAYRPTTSFIGLASTITALVGVVQVPARHLLADWNFRVYADPAGLRLRHGLLTIRSETVPRARVQAVSLLWPALWRPLGWLSARMDVAGYGHAERGTGVLSGRLLPIGDAPTARALVAESLGGVDVATLTVAVPPARARWLAPLRQPVIGVGVTPEVVVTRDGWLRRQLVIAPLARVQSVRVVQGPVQRALRLASVHVDTAGGIRAVAEHRDVEEAYALAAMLATASGAARAADRAATR